MENRYRNRRRGEFLKELDLTEGRSTGIPKMLRVMTANELTRKLGLRTKTGAFKRTIRELIDLALIEYTLPNQPVSRLQKYRLSEKGKRFLEDK